MESSSTWICSSSRGYSILRDFFDQPLHHVALVIERQLDGHARELARTLGRLGAPDAAVLEVLADHLEAVAAVKRKDDQDREIRNQQRPIEKFKMMNAGKGVVKERAHQLIGCGCCQKQGYWNCRYNH